MGNIYAKARYYGGLKAVEVAVITSGLSYNDQLGDYSRLTICKFIAVELSHNPKEIANNWNYSIALWLKKYVYIRLN